MGGIHRKLTSLGHGLLLQKDCCCRSLQVDFLLAKCELFWILPVPPKWMNYNLKTIPTVLRKNIVKIFGIYRFLLANTTFQEQILVFYVYVKMERNSTARPSDVLHLRTVFSTPLENRVVSSSVWTKLLKCYVGSA